MYERISAVLPRPVLAELHRQLLYNNIRTGERVFAGVLIVAAAIAAAIIAVIGYFLDIEPLVVFPLAFAAICLLAYLLLRMSSESKGRFVEGVLPDALQLIASNMKSGLTTEKAIFVAGRPEFGPLQLELRSASKRISSGERVEIAITGISDRINSVVLEKTLWLISEGVKSGGQISDLLLQIAQDLRNQQAIQDEIKANISIYVLLILFASVFGAPLLFGVSSFIVQSLSKQIGSTPSIDTASLGNVPGNLQMVKSLAAGKRTLPSLEFITFFSIVSIILTSVFSSLTIGVINSGKETNGLKYVLPITVSAIVVFFIIRGVLTGVFQSII